MQLYCRFLQLERWYNERIIEMERNCALRTGAWCIGYRVQGIGRRVQDVGYRVQGIGCRVQGIRCKNCAQDANI